MLKMLFKEKNGFSGTNHVLIAIALFELMFIFGIYAKLFPIFITPLQIVFSFFIVCGAALLPDMDLTKSEGAGVAAYKLGFLGTMLSSTMVIISSLMTSIFHTKKDVKPFTQHRFFWHTLLIPVIIFLLVRFCVPDTGITIWEAIQNKTWPNLGIIVVVVSCGFITYLGASIVLEKIAKYIPFISKKIARIIIMILSIGIIVYCSLCNYAEVKAFGYCIALGYLLHLCGDIFADGSIPLLFPLDRIIRGKYWGRFKIWPFTVKTGSLLESMLKLVFLAVDLVLAYICIFGFTFPPQLG